MTLRGTISISVMLTAIVFMLVLLISCLLSKERENTMQALIWLIIAEIIAMLIEITELLLFGAVSLGDTTLVFPWKLSLAAEYSMNYFLNPFFLIYITRHINNCRRDKDLAQKEYNHLIGAMFLFALGLSLIEFSSVWNGWIFFVKDNGTFKDGPFYFWHYLIALALPAANFITTVKNHREIGAIETACLLLLIIMPVFATIFEIETGFNLGFPSVAMVVLVVYIAINLRSREKALAQKAVLARQQEELTTMRVNLMISQMQPHFVYNTLTTVSGLCYMEDAPRAKSVVDHFAEYMRQNSDFIKENQLISFDKELDFLKNYLWIEQVRFGDDLRIEYDIETSDFVIPALTVQPLAENAVKHGIRKKKNGGTVRIIVRETPASFVITVTDDGAGFDPTQKQDDGRSHVGIENVRARLEMLCGGTLIIDSVPDKGTTAVVTLPKRRTA